MEVRGEVRGESGCFMGAMRALLNTIRNRLRPKRKRQRTKNYRICHNSAMAKIKRRKLKKQLTTGLNIKLSKPNHVAKGTSVRAFQERRKPRWVLQTREDLQPAEPASDPNTENTQAREDLKPAELASEVANIDITQPGEVLQPAELDLLADEPASLGLIHRQLCRRDLTGQDRVAIMYSGPFSFLVPSEWALDHLMSGEQDSRPYTMAFY
ncbi:uncharacterized protein LOC121698720 isoform X2 [Alosa sapidissima]|uniref:uncharacterized protein LOC121698720 isoform X2 n=1 Tax=Alosa sapidissima TaxID=34773 RepID=UPI001C097C7C|nr:uncharacterized protein LOC121698720 isoform X2 [Alosa sapidissima]